MSTPLVDRFHFLARAGQQEKTKIRAEAPTAKDGAAGSVTLRLYDVIDSWGGPYGISAKEFVEALDALPDDTTEIRLRINSPGGEVHEAIALLNALRSHPARVVAVVDGIAASSASFIAAGVDELVMARNSELFVHDAWAICVGNAADMHKMANDLDHFSDNIASIYASKSNGEVAAWRSVMSDEKWFSAEEAVAAGLADRIDAATADDKAKNRFDLSVFQNSRRRADDPAFPGAPRDIFADSPAPQTPGASASGRAAAGGTNPKEDAVMADTLTDGLRQRLGIADDADEATILAALDEALAEQADPAPETEVIAPAALAEVTRLSTELAEVKAAQAKRDKDELFASWLRDGKTSPAERTQLEAMYDAAPAQTAALVNARAKGSVVPVDAVGADTGAEATADDLIYAELFGATPKGA